MYKEGLRGATNQDVVVATKYCNALYDDSGKPYDYDIIGFNSYY